MITNIEFITFKTFLYRNELVVDNGCNWSFIYECIKEKKYLKLAQTIKLPGAKLTNSFKIFLLTHILKKLQYSAVVAYKREGVSLSIPLH